MKALKFILPGLLAVMAMENGFATAQISDKLIYNGKEYLLQSTPLEKFFRENPSRKPSSETMTALWRGYRATFEIVDNLLMVEEIEIIASPEEGFVSAMQRVFPDGHVKAEWYSGILIVPYGEVTGYEKDRFAAVYSDYMVIEIKDGCVGRIENFTEKDYNDFMDAQFDKFRHSTCYVTATDTVTEKFPEAEMDFIDLYIRQNLTDFLPGIL